ncbi:MAG TPA: flagellar export chaperone FliS [Geobacteraceae bacterium]|nr:flagellar export chaperone FliS [Geobacteraceae bacterium]
MQMPLNQYRQTQVNTSSPEKILLMLYDGAINFSRIAMEKAANGDKGERGKYVSKAQAIVAELMNTLDHEVGGAIAGRLTQLYMYIINEYVRANVNNSVDSLENTVKILAMLRDTWAEAIEIVQRERETGASSRKRTL